MCVGLMIGNCAIIDGVGFRRGYECGCGRMASKKGLKCASGRPKVRGLFDGIATCGLSYVKRSFSGLEGTKDSKEFVASTSRKAIECVADKIRVYVLVHQGANSEPFRSGTVVYIRDAWDAPAYRKASYNRCGTFVVMGSYRQSSSLFSRCECTFHKKTLRMSFAMFSQVKALKSEDIILVLYPKCFPNSPCISSTNSVESVSSVLDVPLVTTLAKS